MSSAADDDHVKPQSSPADESAVMRVWSSFFNAVFELAEEAIKSRKIPLTDLRHEEPYVYLGLIGVTVLKCAQRSARQPDRSRLVLATDTSSTVALSLFPARHRSMFETMCQVVEHLPTLPDELWCLEQLILYGQSEQHKVVTALDPRTVVGLQRVAAMIQSVAIHISQQAMFRDEFKTTTSLLLAMYREL